MGSSTTILSQQEYAGFRVREEDPLGVDASDLDQIEIWGTVFEGEPRAAQRD